jgi:hypothetical protein
VFQQFVGIIAIAYIDRVGREPLLLIGSVGMVIGLGVGCHAVGAARRDVPDADPRRWPWAPRRTGSIPFVVKFIKETKGTALENVA